MINTALLLTQYERFGSVGTDEYIENYIPQEIHIKDLRFDSGVKEEEEK